MRKGIRAALVIAAGMGFGAPASAQYMMHLDPNLYILATMNMGGVYDPCMDGTARSAAKIAEARTPAPAVMQAYFTAAQTGGPKSAAFHLDKNTKWKSGSAEADSADLDRQVDPLALPGHTLDAEPVRFYRAGGGATALGQWAVLDAQGQVVGAYTALFAGVKKVWKLRELTVSQAQETLAPAAQYCRKPGDVIEHRLSSTKTWREGAAKSVEEAKTKLSEASAAEEKARLAAEARPRDKSLALATQDAQRKLNRWVKQLDEREKNLAKALEKSAEAQKDADALKALTGEARTVRAFKVVDAVKDTAATDK
jgi:hypothetical protein